MAGYKLTLRAPDTERNELTWSRCADGTSIHFSASQNPARPIILLYGPDAGLVR